VASLPASKTANAITAVMAAGPTQGDRRQGDSADSADHYIGTTVLQQICFGSQACRLDLPFALHPMDSGTL
jgi:hypothetical protein